MASNTPSHSPLRYAKSCRMQNGRNRNPQVLPRFFGAEQLSCAKSIAQYGDWFFRFRTYRQSFQLCIVAWRMAMLRLLHVGNAVGSCFRFFLARRSREVTSSTGGHGRRADAE